MAVCPRRTGIASVAILSGISFALGLAHVIAPNWARDAGLDVWNIGVATAEYRRQEICAEQLDATQDQLARQMEASDQVVAVLIAGEITLSDAVTELSKINRDRPGFCELLTVIYPEATTFQARVARYAQGKVRTRLESDPSRLAEVAARLESEYLAMALPGTPAR
jgi:hypothetical protein